MYKVVQGHLETWLAGSSPFLVKDKEFVRPVIRGDGEENLSHFNALEEFPTAPCTQQSLECEFLVQKKARDSKCCQRHNMTARFHHSLGERQ